MLQCVATSHNSPTMGVFPPCVGRCGHANHMRRIALWILVCPRWIQNPGWIQNGHSLTTSRRLRLVEGRTYYIDDMPREKSQVSAASWAPSPPPGPPRIPKKGSKLFKTRKKKAHLQREKGIIKT